MIDIIANPVVRHFVRPDCLLRLLLIAGFPLAATAPLLGGLIGSQGPVSRQQRELAEEEIAIRCPVMSSVRRTAEACTRTSSLPAVAKQQFATHSKCAHSPDGILFAFRGLGHRVDVATSAPLLC